MNADMSIARAITILELMRSNIKVTGNAKSVDFDLQETSVAFSRVVAG